MMQSQHLFNLKSALHLSIEDDMYVELLKVRLWNDLIHFPYSHSFQTDTKIFWPALNPSLGFKTCTQKSNKVTWLEVNSLLTAAWPKNSQ